jgi:hypothetical protein
MRRAVSVLIGIMLSAAATATAFTRAATTLCAS